MAASQQQEKPVVVITGGDNGIGYYMASALLQDGYRVAVLDLSGENSGEFQIGYPDSFMFLRCDVTSDAEVSSAVDRVVVRWEQIDVLVNNACIALFGPFEQKTIEQTRREFEVNYFGYLRMIYAVLPHMKARSGNGAGSNGIIHNVSSSVGLTGYENIYGYCSTKGAIEALTRTLAMELAPYGITVNTMHPPLTDTKSAAAMGLPKEAMAKPEVVGRRLAKKIMSRKPVVTGDLMTGLMTGMSQRHPRAVGRMLQMMTARAKK